MIALIPAAPENVVGLWRLYRLKPLLARLALVVPRLSEHRRVMVASESLHVPFGSR
jgi:hypothetical protein